MPPDLGKINYRCLGLASSGIIGSRWRAGDRQTGSVHLVDLLPGDTPYMKALAQNALLVQGLTDSPNLANVIRAAILPTGEYAQAIDLAPGAFNLVETAKTRISEGDAWLLIAELVNAVQALHEKQLLHTAINPASIFQDKETIRIADLFWLHNFEGPLSSAMSAFPAYEKPQAALATMAPELLAGNDPSVEADIYSLGAVLFFLLSGQLQREVPDVPINTLRPDLSPALLSLVEDLTNSDWRRRPELGEILEYKQRNKTQNTSAAPAASLVAPLAFQKQVPVCVTAHAYRAETLKQDEITLINSHLSRWQRVLAGNGITYEGVILDGTNAQLPGVIYYMNLSIDTIGYPASLSLVLCALYELSAELSSPRWEIHAIEQVVTKMQPDRKQQSLSPAQQVFSQRIKV